MEASSSTSSSGVAMFDQYKDTRVSVLKEVEEGGHNHGKLLDHAYSV